METIKLCDNGKIREHKSDDRCEPYSENKITDSPTTLLAAEPGMGRSKFLSYTQQNINKYKPGIWVLRINLLENVHTLQTIETEGPTNGSSFDGKLFMYRNKIIYH
jgi:hypothetical protein